MQTTLGIGNERKTKATATGEKSISNIRAKMRRLQLIVLPVLQAPCK